MDSARDILCDTNGLNFKTILQFLGDNYNEKLEVFNRAETDALTRFKKHYIEILEGDAVQTGKKNVSKLRKQGTFDNEYAFKSKNRLEKKGNNDIDYLYEHCFDIIPKEKQEEMCLKKVTVPEPFNLTCYRNNKSNLSKAVDESETITTQTRANPVPAFVYLPLYECMKKQNEDERKERLEDRKKKLLATVKPFELSSSAKEKSRQHSCSLTDLRQLQSSPRNEASKPTLNRTIKANPFPKHLFAPDNHHAIEVEKQLRQIRIKARAEEMLKQSTLPFTGDKITKKWNSMVSLGQERRDAKEKELHTPSEKLYFIIRRPRSSSACDQRIKIQSKSSSQNKNKPVEVVGEKIDISSQRSKKRSILDYERLCQKSFKMKSREKDEEESKPIQSAMRKKLNFKVRLNEHLMNKIDMKAKLRENRKNDQRRMVEYAKEIEEIMERVSRRPLLIERQMMDSLRKSAQKKIQEESKFNSGYHSRRSSRTNSREMENRSESLCDQSEGNETSSHGTELNTE